MKDSNYLEKVAQFMTLFNQPVLDKPTIPDNRRTALRISLIGEELEELKNAICNKDIVEIADAFCDLQYVLTGAIHEFGMGNKFKKMFDNVHESNMSKVCKTIKEANDSIQYYTEKGIDVYKKIIFIEEEKYFIVVRSEDDKVLKNHLYIKANLKPILENE